MSPVLVVLACAGSFVLLGLLTRFGAPRLAFDFTEEGRRSERCSACSHPCDAKEETDV